jgi:hypothetical protein
MQERASPVGLILLVVFGALVVGCVYQVNLDTRNTSSRLLPRHSGHIHLLQVRQYNLIYRDLPARPGKKIGAKKARRIKEANFDFDDFNTE